MILFLYYEFVQPLIMKLHLNSETRLFNTKLGMFLFSPLNVILGDSLKCTIIDAVNFGRYVVLNFLSLQRNKTLVHVDYVNENCFTKQVLET